MGNVWASILTLLMEHTQFTPSIKIANISNTSLSCCNNKKLNDHRLQDGGFVDRLKPTKGYRIIPILYGLITFGHIAQFNFA
mgnify:CR=1 FL=1